MSPSPREPAEFPPPWAAAWGDDACGLWAELEVKGVVQRLRWIEPGAFWMGSDIDDLSRYFAHRMPESTAREMPRHRVRLTHGFWLADTACTQALWVVLMGDENPSRFAGDDQRPVENLSWDDVQGFLGRLQVEAGRGQGAGLPTEAEWEYACRAGTGSLFNVGNLLTAEQANFGVADLKGIDGAAESNDSTRPSRHYRANRWGLYQMHGNVWEWCDDDARSYGRTALADGDLTDPLGPRAPGAEALRAVRGGSWFDAAGSARSASRARFARDFRGSILGFRFTLRRVDHAVHGYAKATAAPAGTPPTGAAATAPTATAGPGASGRSRRS